MPELSDVLLELRDVGVPQLPEAGDAADHRVRGALDRETTAGRRQRFPWIRRKLAIGGLGVPAVVLGAVATAAAATGALVVVNATSVFQNNPQAAGNAVRQTVIPSSVRELASATIPNYGEVQFWGATTDQRGLCSVIRLPDGSWGGYPNGDARGGWYGGVAPGCMQTFQQQVLAVRPGRHPLSAMPLEGRVNFVQTSSGQIWELAFGFVTAQGRAATVQDATTGATAAVTGDGYFLLAEQPATRTTGDGLGPQDLKVLNAAGQPLQPDYTNGKLLPGYTAGPTSG